MTMPEYENGFIGATELSVRKARKAIKDFDFKNDTFFIASFQRGNDDGEYYNSLVNHEPNPDQGHW